MSLVGVSPDWVPRAEPDMLRVLYKQLLMNGYINIPIFKDDGRYQKNSSHTWPPEQKVWGYWATGQRRRCNASLWRSGLPTRWPEPIFAPLSHWCPQKTLCCLTLPVSEIHPQSSCL